MSKSPTPHEARERMKDAFDKPAESLHAAVRDGDLETVSRLLAQDQMQGLNRENYAWGTPLHVATWCDNIQTVRLLLHAGADPLIPWEQGNSSQSVIQFAASIGNHAILREFWDALEPHTHANDKYGSCLVDASQHGHPTIVEWLLTIWKGWAAEIMRKALLAAVSQWHSQVADVLMRHIECEEEVRYQMLEKACGLKTLLPDSGKPAYGPEDQERQRSLVSRLISTKLDPNHRDHASGLPVLHTAASNIVTSGAFCALLASGADPNMQDERGQTVMHRLTSPLPTGNMSNHTTLHNRHLSTPLNYGASVSIGDENGETPLQLAAFSFPKAIFVSWLSHRRDTQYESLVKSNYHGESLLHYAAAGANVEVLECLLELNANAPKPFGGADGIDAETVRQMREQGGLEVNAASTNGWTPFHCALTRTAKSPIERRLGYRSISHEKTGADALRAAQALLSAGADPTVVSAEGWTPLHSLAGHDFPDALDAQAAAALARDLIARGADVNAQAPAFFHGWQDGRNHRSVPWQWRLPWGFRGPQMMATYPGAARRGITPLHWAAENWCVCVARVLLDHGADPLAKDEKGATLETTTRYSMGRIGASRSEEMARLLKRT